MGALLEDGSPLQLAAEGVWRTVPFAIVGRLQVRWSDGTWNEWYCAFDDGRAGWLADAAGEYAMSFAEAVPETLPPWSAMRPGQAVTLGGIVYEVTDVREAEVVGGEGELPFPVGAGWKTRSADLRNATARFATLDYSDLAPRVYLGETVELRALALRGLREREGWH